MRLWCVSRYQSSLGKFRVGEEIVCDDEKGETLLRDSPGSFSLTEPKARAAKAEKSAPAFDLEKATVDELKAFAQAEGIELETDASEEDIRAAIALALEERAKAEAEAKLAKATTPAGGNTRPAKKSNSR